MKKSTFSRIVIIISILFFGLQSYAQNFEPFNPRFNQDLRGDIVLIGNNILGPSNNAFNDNSVFNHNVNMRYIDIDGDPTTFSSSSADLNVPNPNCYRIIYAGLYWGAVNPGSESITNVKLKGPVGDYVDITGTVIYNADGASVDGGNSFSYASFADITDIVIGFGNGTDLGTYTVANVSSDEGRTASERPFNGTGESAGWSLFVVFEDPTFPGRSITSFDGFSSISVGGGNPELDIPVDGFRTIPAPAPVRANFAFAALEGDSPILGDGLSINGVNLSTVDRPVANFFNSSVTQLSALPVNDRAPNSTNTLGFDTGIMAIPNPGNTVIANDATSAVIRLETSGDTFFPYFFALAVDIIEPDIVLTKTVEDDAGDDIGDQTIGLGAVLNYTIGFQNVGNDNATNFQIRDILPVNIIYDHPTGLTLPDGVTVSSYNPATRELIFDIEDRLVEEDDPLFEIRIAARVVDSCGELEDACSNIVTNQAFGTYNGFFNPSFTVSDDPSLNSNNGCLLTPQATNFLADLDCEFTEEIILCGDSVELTAANGFDEYSWSTSPTGVPVIATTQTITVTETGTYYSFNTAIAPCQSIEQVYEVQLFGFDTGNPVIPFADEVVTCPNDGELLPNLFLCGLNDSRLIETSISDATSIIWERLDESSCPAVVDQDCANTDGSCTWNQVSTDSNYLADTSGQYRITINYPGGCFNQFYFNVFSNLLDPIAIPEDIICTTLGSITITNVPSDYEYSLDGINFQASNMFPITTPGTYTAFVRQIGVDTNPCIFPAIPVQVRERDFTATPTIVQPLCHGELGSIQLSANDADPQYSYTLLNGTTLVNSVGPILDNSYTFENLNPGTYTATIETENGCIQTETVIIVEPPLLTATSAITVPLTCEDGEITVFPVGGVPPYFYFVNGSTDFQTVPEIVVTTAGVFNITVIDSNNCSADTTITVEATPEPDFNVATTDIACGGTGDTGTITINVTNANGNSLRYSIDGGATYENSNVFNDLIAGDYEVIVEYTLGTAVCNTDPQTVTINENTAISGTAELAAPFTCTNNGTIIVTGVTGGVGPYTYSIDGINFQVSNTFNDLTPGTYTITIRDTLMCTVITNQITINTLDPPTDLTFSSSPVTCPTNMSTITITGVTGGTGNLEYQIIAPATSATPYQTSTSFPNLEPDTYTFQVRDENNCTYIESFTIDPIPAPTVNVILTQILNCSISPEAIIEGSITGTAPFNYAVSINGGAFSSLGTITGTTFVFTTLDSGTYQFQITDDNGCIVESSVITITPLSLPALNVLPLDTQCNGDSNGSLNITIDTTQGTAPYTININNDTTGINYGTQTSGLPAGTYTVTLTDANSCVATEVVSINEPDPIAIDFDTVPITCNGGTFELGSIIINSVTGGTAPYDYFITGVSGFSDSSLNNTGTTTVSFDIVNFGLYQITVIDANGCTSIEDNVLIASPPSSIDPVATPSVDCAAGGEVVVTITSPLAGAGPFTFSILGDPTSTIPEDAIGSRSATFTGLIPGFTYTFIVEDTSTGCIFFNPVTTTIPTLSSLTATALGSDNVTCTGNADGDVSFTVNSVYATDVNVTYEIFNSISFTSTGIAGTGTVPAGGSLQVNDLGPLPVGDYVVLITEDSGPNDGCGVTSVPFNITESLRPLDLDATIDENANCNANSGIISLIGRDGTAPYQYQITTTAASPAITDVNWGAASVFNRDAGTFYAHVLDANNCVFTRLVPIVLDMDPTPVITAVAADLCTTEGNFEIDVTLTTAGIAPYRFSIDGGAFQTRVDPTFTISNLSSGTHSVAIQDVNGCGNTVSVDISTPLSVTTPSLTLPTCNDDDGEITVNTTGGSGSFTYAITPNPASVTLTGNVFSGVPSGTYTVTITDTVTMCPAEMVTVTLSEPASPTAIATDPTGVICFGDSTGTFDLNISGYTGAYTYEIFDNASTSIRGPINADTTTNPLSITGMPAGNFTIEIIATDSPFCTTTTSVIISSPAEPLTLDANETSNVTCDNNQGTITAIATGGHGGYQYQLSGDATVAFSTNSTFRNLSAGNYTITVRDAEGCITTDNIILVEPDPINAPPLSNTALLCFGDQNGSITVTNVTGGQGTNYTYTLTTILPTPSVSGPQTSNVFNNLGAGTYSVTITDGNECIFTTNNVVISEPTPIEVDLVKTTNQTCLTEATFTLSATGGTGLYTYSDDASFTSIIGTFASSITFSAPPGRYQFYVRDANNCVANVSNEITVDPLVPLEVNLDSMNPTINCAGDNNGFIVATAQGGLGDYIYTLLDLAGNVIPATQNSPGVFTELVAGDYIVNVQSGDCVAEMEQVTISEPTSSLTAIPAVNNVTCNGQNDGSIEITASGGTGEIRYAISPQSDQFFETNIFENLAAGIYEVIVQDALGCFMTLEVEIEEPPIVNLSIVPGSLFEESCEGEADGAFSVEISGGNLPYSVSLDNPDGPFTTGGPTQTVFDFTGLNGGDHIVYVRGDNESCEAEFNITFASPVIIDPVPVVEFLCENNILRNTITVIVNEDIDPADLDYSLNGGPYQLSNVFVNVPPGNGNFVDVRHTNSCIRRTELFDLEDIQPLGLTLSQGSDLSEIVANATGGTGDYQYEFNGEDFGSTNIFVVTEEGTYTVIVTDSAGCQAIAVIEIEVFDPCIPDVFTPNGDGVTDTFAPGCIDDFPNLTFDIFDRYGRVVAELRAGEVWDGRYEGAELPTGDYWYVVRPNSALLNREFVGHFTLYR